jgi:hypothetical protein
LLIQKRIVVLVGWLVGWLVDLIGLMRSRMRLPTICIFRHTNAVMSVFLLSILAVVRLSVSIKSLPPIEMQVLQNLYDTTGGTTWRWQAPYATFGYPWVFSSPQNPCLSSIPWQGIKCSSTCVKSSCNVLSLTLSMKGLTGTEHVDFKGVCLGC